MMMIEDFKKEIQTYPDKQLEALKEETQKSIKNYRKTQSSR